MLNITPLGATDWRNSRQPFGIKDSDRLRHIYVIGKTGTGKSTLLMNMAISDIIRGNGLCLIDPHGDIAESILEYVPAERVKDVIYFNATDDRVPIGFNPLSNVSPKYHHLVASNLVSTFKKIWADFWGPRMEHILRFSLLTLLYYPKATLLDIQPLLTDAYFRTGVLFYVKDPTIIAFWRNEFDKYPPALKSEAIAPILNKTGLLLASLPIRYIIGQHQCGFNMQEIMDEKKILICNLSKGQIGEESAMLLGSMILTAIQSAALFRASYDPTVRYPFYLYVDEMHSFVTLSFADILAEARKYGLSLFLTHQYIDQLHEKIRAAVFGNVGTIISFRIGTTDAEVLAKEFHPVFSENDLVSLPTFAMYLKLMIDGTTSRPFSAKTIPLPKYGKSYKPDIVAASQVTYGSPREEVDEAYALKYHQRESAKGTLFETDR
jgi:hypothetical protein